MSEESENAFVHDAQLYETAEIGLRHDLGRTASVMELAAALEWPEDRVELIGAMLTNARELYDADIVQYLDDES
jgi:hypothetical protein